LAAVDFAITIPNERTYLDVARLVLGGAAARLSLGFEAVDDLQLAVESVLTSGLADSDHVSLEVTVEDDRLLLWLGPIDGPSLQSDLERAEEQRIALGRLLSRLVDDVEISSSSGRTGLLLGKQLPSG
jgi:hypothetical protein